MVLNSLWIDLSFDMKFKNKKREKTNVYEHFSTMVENNTTMLQQFAKINVFFKNIDVQIKHVIDKL
jgi:hypothetical protein